MIDQITTLILREARGRAGKDRIQGVYDVMKDVEIAIKIIIDNVRLIERDKYEHTKEG